MPGKSPPLPYLVHATPVNPLYFLHMVDANLHPSGNYSPFVLRFP